MNPSQSIQPEQSQQQAPTESNPKRNKKPLLIGLIVALVISLGVGGYLYYSHTQDLKKESAANAQRVEELKKKLTESTKTTDVSEDQESSYLEVPQWGIKFKEEGDKLSYKIEKKDGTEYLMLTNSTGKSIKPESCPDLGDALYLVSVTRSKTSQPSDPNQLSLLSQIGEYYYFMTASNGYCSNAQEESEMSKEAQVRSDLLRDVKTIQAIN